MRYNGLIRTMGVAVGLAAIGCGGEDDTTPPGMPDTGTNHPADEGGGGQGGGGQGGGGGQPQMEAGNTDSAVPSEATPGTDAKVNAEAGLCKPTDAALTAPTVPDAIKVPAGATLVTRFFAQGDQVYTCTDTTVDGGDAGPMYTWVLKAPDAKLYDPVCMVVGAHYAGPTWWIAMDGSSVVGARLASAPSSQAGSIPQLLLKATSHDADGGPGVFSTVTFIQRLDTTDGAAPASCAANDVGHELRVSYTANYYFYSGGISDAGDAGGD